MKTKKLIQDMNGKELSEFMLVANNIIGFKIFDKKIINQAKGLSDYEPELLKYMTEEEKTIFLNLK